MADSKAVLKTTTTTHRNMNVRMYECMYVCHTMIVLYGVVYVFAFHMFMFSQ